VSAYKPTWCYNLEDHHRKIVSLAARLCIIFRALLVISDYAIDLKGYTVE
jgi:hypothetical protein